MSIRIVMDRHRPVNDIPGGANDEDLWMRPFGFAARRGPLDASLVTHRQMS
jgi:hypothetical protein